MAMMMSRVMKRQCVGKRLRIEKLEMLHALTCSLVVDLAELSTEFGFRYQ
ncbi:integrase [Sesbania bispinosa]|nr:integrase [Sesbania bispinosa]